MTRPLGRLAVLAAFAWLSSAGLFAQTSSAATIPIPDGAIGIGFDDLRYAPGIGKLLAPAGRAGLVALVDPASREVTAIRGFGRTEKFSGGHDDGPTSADEAEGLLFVTDRTTREIVVVDPRGRRIVSRSKLGSGPDYVRYVAATKELWVTEPDSERIEIFRLEGKDPVKPVASGLIEVKGGPESIVIDASRGRVYTHLWAGKTVAIDVKTRKILSTWTNECKASRGIALDSERGFLFVGCGEGKAVTLEVADGRALSSSSSGDGVDIIDYSPRLAHLYLPGGKSATMATFAVSAQGQLSLLGTVPTAPGSHCVAADTAGHAYVCDPAKGRLLVFEDRETAGGKR